MTDITFLGQQENDNSGLQNGDGNANPPIASKSCLDQNENDVEMANIPIDAFITETRHENKTDVFREEIDSSQGRAPLNSCFGPPGSTMDGDTFPKNPEVEELAIPGTTNKRKARRGGKRRPKNKRSTSHPAAPPNFARMSSRMART